MFSLDIKTQKEILIKKIEDEITDILTQFGKVRRATIHYLLARLGLVANPGEDGRNFQNIIDSMERKGLIVMHKSKARGTFVELS
jgi:hypothetical protein